ncbi:polyprenyl synthetase family protein [Sciscionella sediminilitoris]|uniref:polyprenyl synthetase family protein n=1 Tax=Sciscionella sediminilitoris TaxID=1445613 RepID=UPI0004DEECB3|nr:polyprenyl synthetase family protein [Sciscionella sp. SE31]
MTTTEQHRSATEPVRDRVNAVLAAYLDEHIRDWSIAWGGDSVGSVLRSFVLDGGKRLRPTLCYWGWRAAGGTDGEPIINVAAAVEMFHDFALVHDDVLDNSPDRRGNPTVHRAVAEAHAGNELSGDPEAHGRAVAILLGDLLMSYSDQLLHASGFPRGRLAAAAPVWYRMREEVIAGQYLDVRQQALGPDYEQALRVVHYKTAEYSVHRPLELGGALAGAGPELQDCYTGFGVPIGVAFQLRDDVLGMFGDPAVTGKSASDDLREGKPTVLIALATQRASRAQLDTLNRLHGKPDLREPQADLLREIVRETGALATVERLIEARTETALHALENGPVDGEPGTALRELATAMTRRSA